MKRMSINWLIVFGFLFYLVPIQGTLLSISPQLDGASSSIVYGGYTGQLLEELFGNPDHQILSKKLDLEKMRKLLDAGANVNIVNMHGMTLFMAVIVTDRIVLKKKEQIIQLMLAHAHNLKNFLDHKDEDGKTPFWCAADREYLDIMFLLEHNGVDIEASVPFRDAHGDFVTATPLGYASYFGLEKVRIFYINRLIEYVAKITQTMNRSALTNVKYVISWEDFPSASQSPCSPLKC